MTVIVSKGCCDRGGDRCKTGRTGPSPSYVLLEHWLPLVCSELRLLSCLQYLCQVQCHLSAYLGVRGWGLNFQLSCFTSSSFSPLRCKLEEGNPASRSHCKDKTCGECLFQYSSCRKHATGGSGYNDENCFSPGPAERVSPLPSKADTVWATQSQL